MRALKNFLPSIFPKVAAEEPQQTKLASHRIALQTMLIVGVLTSIYLYIITELSLKAVGIFSLGFILYLITILLYRSGKTQLSKWMMVVTIWTSFTLFLFLCGAIDQFVFIGYFVVVIISGMFLGDLQAYLFSAVVALTSAGFLLTAKYSYALAAALGEVNHTEIVFQTIFLILAALVGRALAREREVAVSRLVALSQKAQAIFEQSPDAIFITDLDFIVTEMNLEAANLLNRPLDKVLGESLLDFVPTQAVQYVNELVSDTLVKGSISKIEIVYPTSRGVEEHIQVSANLIAGDQLKPDHFQIILRDITARKHAESLVQRLAMQDHLTKVDNRLSLQYRLSSLIAQMKQSPGQFAVVYFDLDDFKSVNDRFGHPVGDQLLVAFTKRLLGAIRESDFLARIGGDEFVLIIENYASPEELELTLARIVQSLSEPFKIKTHLIDLVASYGISHFPADGDNPQQLLARADSAMYSSKST
ncbi:MAG: GGDEF domain-containing protein [Chloroflexota bacterium]